MENKGLVSVCILGYNHEKYVKSCISSIVSQTYQSFEIIALEDGSPDGTFQELQNATKSIPQKCIVSTQKNTGNVPLNINRLIAQASGEYIYFISMDDMLKENSLQTMVDILNEDSNIQFCAGERAEVINEDGKKTGKLSKSPFFGKSHKSISVDALLASEIENSDSFYIQSILFRKNIIDAVGGFDEDMIGDDIVLRTKIAKHMLKNPEMTFRIINDSIFLYRHHENNLHKNIKRQVETVYQVQERYGDGLKSQHIHSWSMHGIRQYMQKIDHFVLHKGNAKNRNRMIAEIMHHYNNLYTDKKLCLEVNEVIKLRDVKLYFKTKIRKFFKKLF